MSTPTKIVVVGTGFAGLWSALSAQRLIKAHKMEHEVQVIVISPEPSLVIRVRLYEENASKMSHPLDSLFESVGVRFHQGYVEDIDADAQLVRVKSASDTVTNVHFDRLVLATGSHVIRPSGIPGLRDHAFDIDSLGSASKLEAHLKGLSDLPSSIGQSTVVVCGAGFTGIELAAELPGLLKHFNNPRIILVEKADEIGPELGAGPRPTILKAMKSLGIHVMVGSAISSVDENGVFLTSGERIETKTVIWTAGVRANTLTEHLPGERDLTGRLHVDQDLRLPGCSRVFVTGDTAHAMTDDSHPTLMSCQHAMRLGRVAGYNAAADMLGLPLVPYSQPAYVTCLDLGSWGALISTGWEREVQVTGLAAKQVKRYINQKLIYPPEDADEALAAADPVGDQESLLNIAFGVLSWTMKSWLPLKATA